MAYSKTTWVDNSTPAISATNLNKIEQGIEDAHALIGGAARGQYLTVGSVDLPSAARNACDYVCDGVNDQVQINQALLRASRPVDGFGGEGYIGVALVGPTFTVGDTGTTPITMYPSTHLTGSGNGTLIIPNWSTNVDRGAIELVNSNASRVLVSHLTIGKRNATDFNGHGIKFVGGGVGDAYEIKSGNDPFNMIAHVNIHRAARKGIWCTSVTGNDGGSREMQISHVVAFNCTEQGILIDGSSDSQVSDCRVTGGAGYPGYELGGGNTRIANCKAYYRGNKTGATTGADGFLVSSSRCEVVGCAAQDCGGNGFNFTGGDVTVSQCLADSNSTGFRIAASGSYSSLQGLARGSGNYPQTTCFSFSGSPQVMLTGRVADTGAVSGTPGSNSFIRIVRSGTTVYTAG